jgi:hypothetical protein
MKLDDTWLLSVRDIYKWCLNFTYSGAEIFILTTKLHPDMCLLPHFSHKPIQTKDMKMIITMYKGCWACMAYMYIKYHHVEFYARPMSDLYKRDRRIRTYILHGRLYALVYIYFNTIKQKIELWLRYGTIFGKYAWPIRCQPW